MCEVVDYNMYLGMEGVLSTLVGFRLQLIELLTPAIPILDDNGKMHDHYQTPK